MAQSESEFEDDGIGYEHFAHLDRGDEFEVRVRRDDSDYERVVQFTVTGVRERGDRNGFLKAETADGDVRRFYVDDEGRVTVSRIWSPSENVVRNMATTHDTLHAPDYELAVTKRDGEIESVELEKSSQATGPRGPFLNE